MVEYQIVDEVFNYFYSSDSDREVRKELKKTGWCNVETKEKLERGCKGRENERNENEWEGWLSMRVGVIVKWSL